MSRTPANCIDPIAARNSATAVAGSALPEAKGADSARREARPANGLVLPRIALGYRLAMSWRSRPREQSRQHRLASFAKPMRVFGGAMCDFSRSQRITITPMRRCMGARKSEKIEHTQPLRGPAGSRRDFRCARLVQPGKISIYLITNLPTSRRIINTVINVLAIRGIRCIPVPQRWVVSKWRLAQYACALPERRNN